MCNGRRVNTWAYIYHRDSKKVRETERERVGRLNSVSVGIAQKGGLKKKASLASTTTREEREIKRGKGYLGSCLIPQEFDGSDSLKESASESETVVQLLAHPHKNQHVRPLRALTLLEAPERVKGSERMKTRESVCIGVRKVTRTPANAKFGVA